ncbi:MAG: NifU family protein [Clostridia bacterium]|nr:NifU family protein [Clostridia bacterium]
MEKTIDADMKDYVENTLRPLLRGDGGELEYVSFDGKTVEVILRGECSKCRVADRCLRWCEEKTLADTGRQTTFAALRRKPYFWDK